MCLELALEGERLCKSGDCNAGVAFFQVSIHLLRTTCFDFSVLRLTHDLRQNKSKNNSIYGVHEFLLHNFPYHCD